jgi:hypothetical protein
MTIGKVRRRMTRRCAIASRDPQLCPFESRRSHRDINEHLLGLCFREFCNPRFYRCSSLRGEEAFSREVVCDRFMAGCPRRQPVGVDLPLRRLESHRRGCDRRRDRRRDRPLRRRRPRHPVDDQFAMPLVRVPWSDHVLTVFENEVFDASEAGDVYWYYFQHDTVPSGYSLRKLDI